MIIIKALAVVFVNFILYLAFGSFFTVRSGRKWSLILTVAIGFFAYYAVFALVCLPVMFTYRPLSLLTRIWLIPCILACVCSLILYGRQWKIKALEIAWDIRNNTLFCAAVAVITLIFAALAVITYSFTLDAAYYVATVTTNVDTNMINVYDAFTGNWMDHFELRYVFATYYVNDSVVCRLTGLPALVETKSVMTFIVMTMANALYVLICRRFFEDRTRALSMYILMALTNFMFISLYTSSDFLMTRTYEGKSIVGNISLILIFVLYMMLIDGENRGIFIKLFVVCLGTATVSSTANMVIPAAVAVLFVPYAFIHKKPLVLVKIFACIIPELVMMIVYVLYVKGYFAIYTFPR
ncbi:MAG: hypothetical protein K6E49_10475 [Lachnospiraceae bacterium]|nr:hypothetical protein [Lachnospiraceae bacterium]